MVFGLSLLGKGEIDSIKEAVLISPPPPPIQEIHLTCEEDLVIF